MGADRDEALERIAQLAGDFDLSADEVAAHLATRRPSGRDSDGLAQRILGWTGGVFVLAGWLSAVDLFWDELGSAGRVLVVFGPGLAALLVGLAARRDRRFQAVSTPLFLIAALLQPAGLFVLVDAYLPGDDPALGGVLVFGVIGLQWALLFVWGRTTSLLFLTVAFAVAWLTSVLAWLDFDADLAALVIGISGLLVTSRIDRSRFRAFAPLAWFGFAVSVAIGGYGLLEGEFPFDLALIGLAAGLVQLGVGVHSRALLVAGVLSMLGYLGYFTAEYFAELLSWPIALLLTGGLMLGVSGYALRIGRRIDGRTGNRADSVQ